VNRCWAFGILVIAGAFIAAMFSAVAAADSGVVPTLAVNPPAVRNGGIVTASGTATCSAVVIDAHPGALGVQSIGPIIAPVRRGRFSIQVHLPVFVPDPSRPGLDSDQNFNAVCSGSVDPSATAHLTVTGIDLPRTGANSRRLTMIGVGTIVIGLAALGTTRRRAAQRGHYPAPSRP
jgi:hypothetical protein